MKNSVLPIYHLALLRGHLLTVAACPELFESLEALYNGAVRGSAMDEIEREKAPERLMVPAEKPKRNYYAVFAKNEKTELAPPRYILGDNAKSIMTPEPALSVFSPSKDAENMQQPVEKLPIGNTDEENQHESQIPEIKLPIGIKATSAWPAVQIWTLFIEREKEKPTSWEKIGDMVGKTPGTAQMKYSNMKKRGELDVLRAALIGTPGTVPNSTAGFMPPPVAPEPKNIEIHIPCSLFSDEAEDEGEPTATGDDAFETFWEEFHRQRRGSKHKAFSAWKPALARAGRSSVILVGLAAYKKSDEVARGFAKGTAAWLNDDRWTNDYGRKPYTPAPYQKLQADHNEYAGKRDDRTLVDADWPDIRHRLDVMQHSITSIAGDYKSRQETLETFVRNQRRREELMTKEHLQGESPGKRS